MNEPATMHTGPLGSAVHVLRADPDTIAELAAIDWNHAFRRGLPRPDARACHPEPPWESRRLHSLGLREDRADEFTDKILPGMRERALRLVLEHKGEHDSRWPAITSVASKLGCTGQTLRKACPRESGGGCARPIIASWRRLPGRWQALMPALCPLCISRIRLE